MSRATLQTPYTGSLAELKQINTPSIYKGSASNNNAGHLKRSQLDSASKALKATRDKVAKSEAKKTALIAFPLPPKDLTRARASTSRIRKHRKGLTVIPRTQKQPKLFAVSEADEDDKRKTSDGMDTGDYPPLSGGRGRKRNTRRNTRTSKRNRHEGRRGSRHEGRRGSRHGSRRGSRRGGKRN